MRPFLKIETKYADVVYNNELCLYKSIYKVIKLKLAEEQ